MDTIAIIPARGGSKGIPRKNILDFCGKPLIAWSIEQVLQSHSVQHVYVTTDDAEIARIASGCGARIIRRPKELATDTASSEDALLHAVDEVERDRGQSPEVVVFLQATSPLRFASDIDNALRQFANEGADSLFSGAPLDDLLIWGLVDGQLGSINYDYRDRGRRQDRAKQYVENGSIYIFKTDLLRRTRNRLGGRIAIYEMEPWQTYEIDTYDDIELCKYYCEHKLLGGTSA